MPRTGWLAVGAVVGALATGFDDRRVLAGTVGFIGLALIGGLAAGSGWRPRLLAIAIGAAAITGRAILVPASAPPPGAPEGAGPWRMTVESMGSPRAGKQTATVRSDAADDRGTFRLTATLPRYPELEPGDVVEVAGRARRRPDGPYGQYLERIGAWGTLDARSLVIVAKSDAITNRIEHLRRAAGDLLTHVLPEPEAGLAAGILIGLRDRVDRDVAAAFTTAGVSHVVAISGWNIAIVAAAIAAVAGRIGRRRRAVVTAAAIVAYIAFAGASPSVLRAGAMAGVVLFARETGRAGRAAGALAWAATLLLVTDPSLIGDAGFQLSSLATAGLIAWATPLTERLDRWSGGRLPRWLGESLGVSLAAQAATLPIVIASFGRLALISPAVNVLVVPLVAPAMAAGVVALVAGGLVIVGVPAGIGAILAAPGWIALRVMIGIIEVAARVPLASISVPPVVGVALGAGTAALILGMATWRPTTRAAAKREPGRHDSGARHRPQPRSLPLRLATGGLIVAVAAVGAVALSRSSGVARISVLDVGQGDAILVEGSRGGRLLIDGGPDPNRLLVQLDRRVPPWDRRLDVVVLSHPHEDHVAGLALLLARYRVGRVLEPGMRGPGPGYTAWLDRLRAADAPVRGTVAAGDHLSVDGITMRVLWPIRGQVPASPPDTGTGINNVSIVLLGAVGNRRFLLAGDVEQDIDPKLLAEGLPQIDFLKVAHHGSRTATTEPFVEAVRPGVAVASAGAGNPYGHPARATLDRLRAIGAQVFRTDRDGTVTVSFEGTGMTVRTEPRAADVRRAASSIPAVRSTTTRTDGPRRAFGCAIPLTPSRVAAVVEPPTLSPAARPMPGAIRDLRYHRPDADQRADRALDDRPAPVRLGRRRARRGAVGAPIRVRVGGSARRTAPAVGSPRRPADRHDRCRLAVRAPRDARDVRWRHARGDHQPERARSAQRHA
jgi:competence protein ComEC